MTFAPTPDQELVLGKLKGTDSIFLTGPAGVGKSFILKKYLMDFAPKTPVLASTGAAAVLIQGRTFHSFFGLGIMEGGLYKTVQRASESSRVKKRISKAQQIVIDEISMIHPSAFEAADLISKTVRQNTSPFGGLRLILSGDFFQLPPVDRFDKKTSWLFNHPLWKEIQPLTLQLHQSLRTENQDFVRLLAKIRKGIFDTEVEVFLNSRLSPLQKNFQGTVLFGRKAQAELYNQEKLNALPSSAHKFETQVSLSEKVQTPKELLIGYSPLPEVLTLKKQALVMIRKNDVDGQFVNGSLGFIQDIRSDNIQIELMNGKVIHLPQDDFQILDGDGNVIATIRNFPLTLGWATTIHKSQGASIDRLHVNLKNLWECGQAYVALSRAKDPLNLFIEEWSPRSIKSDPQVVRFYENP